MSAAALAARDQGSSSTNLFSVAFKSLGDRLAMSGVGGGGASDSATSRRDEVADTLCDVVTRLQLLVLLECDAAKLASEHGGYDPLRQLQEMLQCAACWCQKPTLYDEAAAGGAAAGDRIEPSKAQQQAQMGAAVSRLMQAWPHATGGALGSGASPVGGVAAIAASSDEAVGVASSSTSPAAIAAESATAAAATAAKRVASGIAPVMQWLLKKGATTEELGSIPSLSIETPSAVQSVQRFADSWQSWRVMLLREPFLTALRALEQADSPAKVASDRWAARQRALVDQEDRTQREQRALADRVQAEANAALKHLSAEVAPRVAVSRSITARAHAASAQQWWWTRYRLRDDHAIWGVSNATDAAEAGSSVSGGGGGGAASVGHESAGEGTTLRLCEWLDLRSRHMLVVPSVDPPQLHTAKQTVHGKSQGGVAQGGAAQSAAPTDAGDGTSREAGAAAADGGASEKKLLSMGVRLPKLLSTMVASTLVEVSTIVASKVGGETAGGGDDGRFAAYEEAGDEDEEDEEGEEDAEGGAALVEGATSGRVGSSADHSDPPSFHTEAELVRPYGLVPGRLYISARHLRFLSVGGASDGFSGGDKSSALGENGFSATLARDSAIAWPLSAVKQMHRRRYLMDHSALELFDDGGDILLFNFRSKRARSTVRRWIKKKCVLEYRDRDRGTGGFRQLLHELQEAWHRRELSNFEYLMRLNELAGRTHNDLNQYPVSASARAASAHTAATNRTTSEGSHARPFLSHTCTAMLTSPSPTLAPPSPPPSPPSCCPQVFPWVLKDYTSKTLDLADPSVYRDLSRPMGAQVPEQRELVSSLYAEFSDPNIPKFHYGSHFSTMGFVLYYLMRVEPFTSYHKALQSGRFDHADRLFHSIERTYHSCTHSSSDVKELVPEMYYLPDLFLNRNACPLGTRQDGQKVDDVLLPPWATDATDFIAKHRAALESDHVSQNLHLWIDLIFGWRQRGKAAAEALNVFFYLTYDVDFRGRSAAEVRGLKDQINNFGQMPQQLLTTPHPQRRPRPPPPLLTSRQSAEGVGPSGMLRLEAIPLALLALDETLVFIDAVRRVHHHKIERGGRAGGALAQSGVIVGGTSEHTPRLSAFAPNLPLSRAVALAGVETRGRDALLVSGAHWDCSVCVSLAHGSGGTRQRLRYHSDVVTCVAVSSCGKWMMSGSLDATALLWSLGEGGLQMFQQQSAPSGKPAQPAAAGAAGYPGGVAAGAMAHLEPSHVLRGHSAAVLCVALSSSLRLAASGSRDGTTALYTLRDGKRVRALREPGGAEIEQLLLCDAGYVLIAAAAGSRVHLFTLNGLPRWSWQSAGPGVSALSLARGGGALLCGFDDGAISVWRLHDRAPLAHYVAAPAPVVCIAHSDSLLFVGSARADLLTYPVVWNVDVLAAAPEHGSGERPEEPKLRTSASDAPVVVGV